MTRRRVDHRLTLERPVPAEAANRPAQPGQRRHDALADAGRYYGPAISRHRRHRRHRAAHPHPRPLETRLGPATAHGGALTIPARSSSPPTPPRSRRPRHPRCRVAPAAPVVPPAPRSPPRRPRPRLLPLAATGPPPGAKPTTSPWADGGTTDLDNTRCSAAFTTASTPNMAGRYASSTAARMIRPLDRSSATPAPTAPPPLNFHPRHPTAPQHSA